MALNPRLQGVCWKFPSTTDWTLTLRYRLYPTSRDSSRASSLATLMLPWMEYWGLKFGAMVENTTPSEVGPGGPMVTPIDASCAVVSPGFGFASVAFCCVRPQAVTV